MIRTLGRFELKTGDNVARNVTRRSALVLALMIVAGAQGLRRDQICELLWGRREQFQARASLRQALVELRHYASSPDRAGLEIVTDSETAKLSAPADAIDLWLFDHLVSLGTPAALEQAAHLYEGELLAGVDMPDEALEWLRPHRETCFRKALQLAEALSELAHLTEDVAACGAALANRLLVSDPAAEDAHRALIRIYQRQGKNSAAARQFKICTEALNQALGVAPERRTAALLTDHTDDRQEQPAPPLQRPPPSAKPSVVVMPFEMLSAGPGSDDYVADGIVEEVTATLSRIRDFFVIARQSAFASREKFADVQQLGKDLGVKYVVQGTLRRAGDQLRVSVRLVEAESRALLWTERYDGRADDLFLLQDRIAYVQAEGHISISLGPEGMWFCTGIIRSRPTRSQRSRHDQFAKHQARSEVHKGTFVRLGRGLLTVNFLAPCQERTRQPRGIDIVSCARMPGDRGHLFEKCASEPAQTPHVSFNLSGAIPDD